MKVATITYSNAQNYGAMLQAYALASYLEAFCKCDVIDYRTFDNRWFKPRKEIKDILISAVQVSRGKRRVLRFEQFRNKYLPLTSFCGCADDLKKLNSKYDCFIVGSDQVWNCSHGVNENFFLVFADEDKKKVAYAASFGSSSIPKEHAEKVRSYLKEIRHISIREKSGAALVENLTGRKPPVVVDPVFLKDAAEWKRIAAPVEMKQPYAFVYSTQKSEHLNHAVEEYAARKKIKIVSTHAIPGVRCVVRKDIGPLEFLGYILNAEYVISTSFHATAFSIILEKNFCVVPHSQTGARVRDLLEDANMAQCIWCEDNYQYPQLDYRKDGINALQSRVNFSKHFLKNCLEEEI